MVIQLFLVFGVISVLMLGAGMIALAFQPPAPKKRIFAFAGRNGCGKETAAKWLAAALGGVKTHTYSDILFETFQLWTFKKEEIPRSDLQALSTFMRELKGEDAMAKVMGKKCRESPGQAVVIDGVRRVGDVDLLYKEFGRENVFMIWIEVPANMRYERLKARKQKAGEAMKPRAQFDQEEMAESERQLDEVRAACAYTIDNGGTLEQYHERLRVMHHDLVIGPVA